MTMPEPEILDVRRIFRCRSKSKQGEGVMTMQDAMNVINGLKPHGYMVAFEWYGDGFLRSDHFPDKHAREALIETEGEAWELARKFAEATKGRTCNLYVLKHDFAPVKGYAEKKIANRVPEWWEKLNIPEELVLMVKPATALSEDGTAVIETPLYEAFVAWQLKRIADALELAHHTVPHPFEPTSKEKESGGNPGTP